MNKQPRRQHLWAKVAFGLTCLPPIVLDGASNLPSIPVKPRVAVQATALPSFKISASQDSNRSNLASSASRTVHKLEKPAVPTAASIELPTTTDEQSFQIYPRDTKITKQDFVLESPAPEPEIDPADAMVNKTEINKHNQPSPQEASALPRLAKVNERQAVTMRSFPGTSADFKPIPSPSPSSPPAVLNAASHDSQAIPNASLPRIQPTSPATPIAPVSSTQVIANFQGNSPIQPSHHPRPFRDHSQLPQVSPEQLAKLRLPPEIDQRTRAMIKQGTSLAKRGALFSARQEFLSVLQLVAQSYDSQLGLRYHSKALANGLRALEEADDFTTRNTDAAVDFSLKAFIAGHKTPVLKHHATDELLPYVAMQRYYDYAKQQLAIAGRGSTAASAALYAIGRTESMVSRTSTGQAASGPKPLAYYQSALAIDQRNNPAANELGVMLARAGKIDQAHDVLAAAARVRPTPTLLNNLAQTRRMKNGNAVKRRPPMTADQISPQMLARRVPVKWVSPKQFSQGSAGPAGRLWEPHSNIARRKPPKSSAPVPAPLRR